MDRFTKELCHWLAKNDLPLGGVKITIEFPNKGSACEAEMCIKRDLEPLRAYFTGDLSGTTIETMNGIGLTLTYRGR